MVGKILEGPHVLQGEVKVCLLLAANRPIRFAVNKYDGAGGGGGVLLKK